ncbi:MAG: putative O-glycosylation ligase, exosortase A system-associated [Parahaliea sp.]
MRDLLLVAFLFVAAGYALRRPYLGVAAWIWIALTAPSEWAFGFSQTFRLNFAIVLITAAAFFLSPRERKREREQRESPFYGLSFLVLLFGFWTLVSTATNLSSTPGWVWSYWSQFAKVLLLFFFITWVLRSYIHIHTLIWAIVLAISSYAAMEAVKFILSGGGHRITGRAGIISDRNDLAVAINMCIPLVIYLIGTTRHKLLKLGLYGLLFLNVISIVGTYSRGGFIGLSILAVAFWLKSRYKLVLALVAVMMIPVAVQFAPEDWKARQQTVSTASQEDGSFIGRLWAWKVSTMIAMDHPLTGGGFGAVMEPNVWSYYAPFTPTFGPIDTPPIPSWVVPKAAHNIFFQVLGDHGMVGLALFLSILALTFWTNLRNTAAARKAGSDWCVKLCNAITLALVGYGITGANVSLAYFDLLYAIVGVVVVVRMNRSTLLVRDKNPIEQRPATPAAGALVPRYRPLPRRVATRSARREHP